MRKGGHYGPDEELIPVTVPEVRRLLTGLVWTEKQPPDFILLRYAIEANATIGDCVGN